jgi:thioredoxin 1
MPLLVACLCAAWCGSCRDYTAAFEEASAEFGERCRFVWIDIEDQADAIGAVDVENFPTLLIARGGEPLFFGSITPHAQTLRRLVESALAGDLKTTALEAEVAELARRLG